MSLDSFLIPNQVILSLKARDKMAALEELTASISETNCSTESQKTEVIEALQKREAESTSALGNGIALPHITSSCVSETITVYARSREGIDFEACDHNLVKHLFLVLTPENQCTGHLKHLAELAKVLRNQDFLNSLSSAKSEEEVLDLFNQQAGA